MVSRNYNLFKNCLFIRSSWKYLFAFLLKTGVFLLWVFCVASRYRLPVQFRADSWALSDGTACHGHTASLPSGGPLPPAAGLAAYSQEMWKTKRNMVRETPDFEDKGLEYGEISAGAVNHRICHSLLVDPNYFLFSQMQYERNLKIPYLLRHSNNSSNHSIRLKWVSLKLLRFLIWRPRQLKLSYLLSTQLMSSDSFI